MGTDIDALRREIEQVARAMDAHSTGQVQALRQHQDMIASQVQQQQQQQQVLQDQLQITQQEVRAMGSNMNDLKSMMGQIGRAVQTLVTNAAAASTASMPLLAATVRSMFMFVQ